MANYMVAGYLFESEAEAKQAKKEADGISYIRAQTRMDDPDVILKLYHRLIKQEVFETVVGIEFLRELQEYLKSIPYIQKENIVPIPVRKKEAVVRERKRAKSNSVYQMRFRIMAAISGILFAIVIGMFAITYISGNSTNIFNYEQQIIDKYEAWEQELNLRESELSKREQILQMQMSQ